MATKPAKKTVKKSAAKKPAKAKRPLCRPGKYTPKLVEDICARLSLGEPLAVICRDEGMPDPATVWRWEQAHEGVLQSIARAREAGYDVIALDALAIADDGRRDYQVLEDGREVVDHDHIARSRLRVDTRLKLLSKWSPRYGDKMQLAGHDGGELKTPPPIAWTVAPVAPKE